MKCGRHFIGENIIPDRIEQLAIKIVIIHYGMMEALYVSRANMKGGTTMKHVFLVVSIGISCWLSTQGFK